MVMTRSRFHHFAGQATTTAPMSTTTGLLRHPSTSRTGAALNVAKWDLKTCAFNMFRIHDVWTSSAPLMEIPNALSRNTP